MKKAGTDILSLYQEKTRKANEKHSKTRSLVKCLVFSEFEENAKRFSANGQVYIAHGVRCDGKKKLQDIVDHLHRSPHAAALERKKLSTEWASNSTNHPWLRTLKSNDPGVIQTLIHLAVDVYNDSKLLTPAAWSWPSRSLAQLHAEEQFKIYGNSESSIAFSPFQPAAIDLHYCDPVHYAEVLHTEGDMEREKLKVELQKCLRFAVQIDGSVDTKQQEKKFVFVRFNDKASPLCIQTRLVCVKEVERRGAEGLFDAVIDSLKDIGLNDTEIQASFAGVTTDGESANTGRKSGLWSRMEEYAGHPTFNFWCACHRSDLAMEDVIRSVPELKIWSSNVVGVSTFYRASGLRTKELKSTIPKMKSFPAHHEVRFAQHLIQLCEAVLSNLDGCCLHWQKIIDAPTGEYDRKEKDKARRFPKIWHPESLHTRLTVLMVDIRSVFRYIEKEFQKKNIILPDILRYRDVALQKLELLEPKPSPGNYPVALRIPFTTQKIYLLFKQK